MKEEPKTTDGADAAVAAPSPTSTTSVGQESPFLEALGIRIVRADAQSSELVLCLDERHHNRWAVAHGGVTMTMLDAALALAARHAGDGARGVVTVEMKVSFMQPGQGELRAHGRVLHRSTTMAFCEGELVDGSGALVAKALGTFKYLRRLPVGRDVASERR